MVFGFYNLYLQAEIFNLLVFSICLSKQYLAVGKFVALGRFWIVYNDNNITIVNLQVVNDIYGGCN